MTVTVLLKKELREQLSTHKLTVIVAAFVALGLISPLTAKMLPELLKSAASEMTVSLPTPTAVVAMDQYLKNLTQMGLLLIVLTAMGAVAGERERGTAAIVLCKPVSRAAFLAAKFIAHAAVIAIGLALGALASYYYTMVLFERPDPSAFAVANALLGVYLLVLLSITLLASAILKSPLAAGGLSLGLAIAISLVGTIPGVAPYSPTGLLNSSRTLMVGTGEPAYAAVLGGLGLVGLCGVLSWAVFRRHEL